MERIDISLYEGHTPGPWTDYGNENGDIYGADGKSPGIIECDSGVYGPYDADRRLVIDAPVILQALKDAYAEIDRIRSK